MKESPSRRQNIQSSNTAVGVLSSELAVSLPCNAILSVPVRRIVTFHLNDLSGLLFTLPALHALREGFPGARITAVMRPSLAALMDDSPFVDEILLRPKGGISKQTALMLQLRQRHFDMALAFSPSRTSVMLAWSSGAATRVGLGSAKMEALLTHRVLDEGPATIETYLEMVRSVGCSARGTDYRGLLQVAPPHSLAAARLLKQHNIEGAFIAVAPQLDVRRRDSAIREWPATHWARALDELALRLPVVLLGATPTPSIMRQVKNHVVDLGGLADLPSLAAICGHARLFVGVDSGVMHLAAAMGTSVVGIFGPTDWRTAGPRGVPYRIARQPVECAPCLLSQCKWSGRDERKCLKLLEPQKVVESARELIGV
jgi:ADP-heptose:LPS heptosyltransferase